MWLYSRSRGEATLAILFLTTGLQGRLATDRNWGGSVDGHWEILKDLCNLWSLENIAFIYSTYPEEELHVGQILKETAEMFADTGVKVLFREVPRPLEPRTFSSVRRFSFVVPTPDEETGRYLQQASAEFPGLFDLFKWIILETSDTNVSSFLLSLETISFRSQVVVVTSRHSTTYTADLVEWYRVVPGGPLRHQLFGRWSRPGGVITSSKDLWQRRSDLEGLQLNVVTVEDPPFVTTLPGPQGYFVDVWRVLEAALNFSSRFSVINEKTFPSLERRLADPTTNGSADVLLAVLTANSVDRVSYLSDPVMKLRFRVYIRRPELPYWKAFAMPFDLGLCCLTVVFLVAASVMLAFSYRWSHQEGPVALTLQDALLVVYGALLQQGSERAPKSWAARLVLWVSLTFGVLLYTAYSATLISSLAVQRSQYPFLSLEQLLESPFCVCVVRNSTADAVLRRSQDRAVSELYEQKIRRVQSSRVANVPEGLKLVSKNKAAAFLDLDERIRGQLDALVCRLADVPTDHFTTYGAFGVRQDLPYKNAIDYYLRKMSEGGIQKRLQGLHWWQYATCSSDRVKSIRLRHVTVVFVYLMVGLLVSAAKLLCELASKWARRPSHGIRRDPGETPCFLHPLVFVHASALLVIDTPSPSRKLHDLLEPQNTDLPVTFRCHCHLISE
ncbi:uncharacterized protein LOC110834355 isoform X2 [Zootermopsis nevadensis]|uniref:uncharacterized protein LOC110834355 isoform X2 n=1 Tax=Zootermopsis nevadensis TaxID=136037 RepID=UPI000B8ECCF9|nr:uncharacterized protein LOC110834355 isoform X2 [Zootermopsis nevadensis]